MKWRPEGWEDKVKEFETNIKIYLPNQIFEAGADAMLEALRNKADSHHIIKKGNKMLKSGVGVFIPDEETQ